MFVPFFLCFSSIPMYFTGYYASGAGYTSSFSQNKKETNILSVSFSRVFDSNYSVITAKTLNMLQMAAHHQSCQLCVIGAQLDEAGVAALFGV